MKYTCYQLKKHKISSSFDTKKRARMFEVHTSKQGVGVLPFHIDNIVKQRVVVERIRCSLIAGAVFLLH